MDESKNGGVEMNLGNLGGIKTFSKKMAKIPYFSLFFTKKLSRVALCASRKSCTVRQSRINEYMGATIKLELRVYIIFYFTRRVGTAIQRHFRNNSTRFTLFFNCEMGAAKKRRQPWWTTVWFGRKPLATLKVCTST